MGRPTRLGAVTAVAAILAGAGTMIVVGRLLFHEPDFVRRPIAYAVGFFVMMLIAIPHQKREAGEHWPGMTRVVAITTLVMFILVWLQIEFEIG